MPQMNQPSVSGLFSSFLGKSTNQAIDSWSRVTPKLLSPTYCASVHDQIDGEVATLAFNVHAGMTRVAVTSHRVSAYITTEQQNSDLDFKSVTSHTLA